MITALHPEHSPDLSGAHGVVMTVESNKLIPWLMTTAILAALAIAFAACALIVAQRSERESRMLQYYVLEMDAKLIAAGVKKPEDAVSKRLESGRGD
jgi:hypothetical protein